MDGCRNMLHVGLLASPGLGHLIPVLALGNRLATHHDVKVTVMVISSNTSAAETQILKDKSDQLVDIIEILPSSVHDDDNISRMQLMMNNTENQQPKNSSVKENQDQESKLVTNHTSKCYIPTKDNIENMKVVTRLFMMVRQALPGVRSTIAAMEKHRGRPDVLIVDLFCTDAFPIADEFNMAKYVYVPTNAWFTVLTIYCHVLDKQIVGQYVDQKEPLKIPGCKSVRPEDVVDPMLDRDDQQYTEYVKLGIGLKSGDGILINTWEDLEPTTLKAMRENETLLRAHVKMSPVYPIGPIRRSSNPASLDVKVKEWLDMQPSESVVYVSFGSGGSLSDEQTKELAWGLEMSEQKFLWVIRPPTKAGSDQAFFTNRGKDSDNDIQDDFLPEGFVSRTKKVGLLVKEWAEQVEILEHPSVGGFLSHCGWNSCLESITNGIPIIAWPLYAEQRTNATLLTEELGVAVRPKVLPTKKVVGREEIGEMIRRIMQYQEGKIIREKIKHLKVRGEKCVDKGGSSYNSICTVLKNVKMGLK